MDTKIPLFVRDGIRGQVLLYPIKGKRYANRGRVNSERRVVRKIACVIKCSSLPYLRQNMIPFAATGIPLNTTATFVTKGSKLNSWNTAHTTRGITNNFNEAIA